ncbi:right-handed parallel beta-helix repeat-containing protein [Polaribacter litorisediminis]|uniref:right-handed parallel beta-helix repeat-containing protein n=1 Tax=Polaribacter litorisediminis TaxID=1908341 RepID=UPI001CBD357A|nr:right-handed parallel beta-helix repeat-containing protein [Polaribacter litorisediminis]UAM97971.1 right-handed parallel beta-helix repeat-containing protein [Polaribacter litorisediminis]
MSKNIKSSILYNFFSLLILIGFFACGKQQHNNYYFHPNSGDDSNAGTSKASPFQSLSKIKELKISAGDTLFLSSNQIFTESLELVDISGSKQNPIVITVYDNKKKDDKAIIKTAGLLNAILVENSSFIEIHNLEVSANPDENQHKPTQNQMRCGVLVETTKPGTFEHIYLNNLLVSDIFFEKEGVSRSKKETKSANGTQNYGWGIRFINSHKDAILKDVKVSGSSIKNVSHTGIKLTSGKSKYGIVDFEISGNQVLETGGPGIQMSGVKNGHIFNNIVDKSGSNNDSRKWGRGSGLWTWGASDILIEKNRFTNANGPGDSAGAHIDYNCNNIVLQYNFSGNNAGGFCEILGNNHNCSYRYNISVNDGHRVKGEKDAFQEGKTFWISAYSGKKRIGAKNSYFYNNTIYVKKEIDAKFAVDRISKGVLIANNIFHIEGDAQAVKGDQYNPESKGKWLVTDVFFKNNLFLHTSSWPKPLPLQDEAPIFGDANFKNLGGFSIADYTPTNQQLIKNKGVKIQNLPKDTIGLKYGLHLEKDILGNKIIGLPDLGAIEMQ